MNNWFLIFSAYVLAHNPSKWNTSTSLQNRTVIQPPVPAVEIHRARRLSLRELLLENVLERNTVFRELLDTFVKLVEGHRVLEECPAELRLVVDEGDLLQGLALGGSLSVELLGDLLCRLLELLEEGWGDGEEVDTSKGFNLADLFVQKIR